MTELELLKLKIEVLTVAEDLKKLDLDLAHARLEAIKQKILDDLKESK